MNPRFLVLLLFLTGLGCGEGASSPGGPTAPTPPAATASIVAEGRLTVGLCSGPGCEYSLNMRNDGNGCANNIHGKIRLYEEDTPLQTVDWWLEATLVLKPGESVLVEDCCLQPDTVRRWTRFTSENFWNNISCN